MMKQIWKGYVLASVLISGLLADTGKREITILEKGVKRHMYIPYGIRSAETNTSESDMEEKHGIVIVFAKGTVVDIPLLEAKYGIKLKRSLPTGYYIFKNLSDRSDADIVADIMWHEKGVRTVKPNWTKQNMPR